MVSFKLLAAARQVEWHVIKMMGNGSHDASHMAFFPRVTRFLRHVTALALRAFVDPAKHTFAIIMRAQF
jgi:hypothetical protein